MPPRSVNTESTVVTVVPRVFRHTVVIKPKKRQRPGCNPGAAFGQITSCLGAPMKQPVRPRVPRWLDRKLRVPRQLDREIVLACIYVLPQTLIGVAALIQAIGG
ncbi:hypothetical protein Ahu01nite_098080 [Winogradskya humida]|uniref:Uncharacterized protein n=1 Tax=Winogradskya humida TaxID=113566 RepID=A0ABQ4A794_9ACTN|nr:hypothetical protein Ahu01nite_098080 [Actinoplanes humidus]